MCILSGSSYVILSLCVDFTIPQHHPLHNYPWAENIPPTKPFEQVECFSAVFFLIFIIYAVTVFHFHYAKIGWTWCGRRHIVDLCVVYQQPVRWPIIMIIIVRWSVCLCIWHDGHWCSVAVSYLATFAFKLALYVQSLFCKIMDYASKLWICISVGSAYICICHIAYRSSKHSKTHAL